jgi:5-methylcytosine-specific restriction endonuclease McrA
MQSYTLDHVTDEELLRELAALVARDRIGTAVLLAHIGEVDARQLYVGAGYPSMHSYCVDELHLSEDSAYKRIRAARAAREFPALFSAVSDGRLHLAAVCLLAPHLTAVNSKELIEAATHRRRFEIEQLLARRFGAPESPPMIRPLPPGAPDSRSIRLLAPGPVEGRQGDVPQLALGAGLGASSTSQAGEDGAASPGSGPGPGSDSGSRADSDQLAPGRVGASPESSPVVPSAPPAERYSLKVTIDKRTHEKLRYAQALLSHAVAGGDIAQVLDRALEALILQLERQKFGATTRPRRARASIRKRHVPAHVRRAVWERDQGQCTFVGPDGNRCPAQRYLEFDHINPVARGGRATVEKMRLRCHAHNQYEADRAFGAAFMTKRRQESQAAGPAAGPAAGQAAAAVRKDISASSPPGNEKPRQLAPPGP